MSTLHTVNKSPFEKTDLSSCLAHARSGDGVLLIEDGVYGVLKGTRSADAIASAAAAGTVAIYVLAPDLAARGLSPNRLMDGIQSVDYAGFVDLAIKHDLTQAWL